MNHLYLKVNQWYLCVRCGAVEANKIEWPNKCPGFPEGMKTYTDDQLHRQAVRIDMVDRTVTSQEDFFNAILDQLGIKDHRDLIKDEFGVPPILCSSRKKWEEEVLKFVIQRRKDNG